MLRMISFAEACNGRYRSVRQFFYRRFPDTKPSGYSTLVSACSQHRTILPVVLPVYGGSSVNLCSRRIFLRGTLLFSTSIVPKNKPLPNHVKQHCWLGVSCGKLQRCGKRLCIPPEWNGFLIRLYPSICLMVLGTYLNCFQETKGVFFCDFRSTLLGKLLIMWMKINWWLLRY